MTSGSFKNRNKRGLIRKSDVFIKTERTRLLNWSQINPAELKKCKTSRTRIQEESYPRTPGLGESKELDGPSGSWPLFATSLGVVGGSSLDPTALTPSDVNLKNKMASYFISKMGFFGNSRGMTVQDKQTMEASQTSPKGQREGQRLLGFRRQLGRVDLNKSSLEKNRSLRLWQFPLGCKCG